MSHLQTLLKGCLPAEAVRQIHEQMYVHPCLRAGVSGTVTRAELAQALNMALFHDLVRRVPAAQDYMASDVVGRRQPVVFDAMVRREFLGPTGPVTREVPGSFYEFISRATQGPHIDLAFDSGNATGIFGMTAAAA